MDIFDQYSLCSDIYMGWKCGHLKEKNMITLRGYRDIF